MFPIDSKSEGTFLGLISADLVRGSIRFGLGLGNTIAEIRQVIEVMPKIVSALRQ